MSEPQRNGEDERRIYLPEPPLSGGSWKERIAWFIGLWLAGVIGVSVVAYGLRLWLL